jgi:hypothetical protein
MFAFCSFEFIENHSAGGGINNCASLTVTDKRRISVPNIEYCDIEDILVMRSRNGISHPSAILLAGQGPG